MERTIRITSGKFKGRKISTPGGKTHPMGERERLALFNMVLDFIPHARVLDAFAGSGALGIEAISRGAETVTFVEYDKKAAHVISENLKLLGVDGDVRTVKVLNFKPDTVFDLVLADPPYDSFNLEEVKALVKAVKENGILVLSHPREAPVIGGLTLQKSKKYAGATISVFVKR